MISPGRGRSRGAGRSVAAAVLASVLVGGGLLAGFLVRRLLLAPWRARGDRPVLVQIPPGSSTQAILKALEEGGLLRDRRLGTIVLKTFHRGRTLKAGEYRFTVPLSPVDLFRPILAGDVVRWKVTVPEGFAAEETFALLESRGFGSLEAYRSLFASPRDFASVPEGAPPATRSSPNPIECLRP